MVDVAELDPGATRTDERMSSREDVERFAVLSRDEGYRHPGEVADGRWSARLGFSRQTHLGRRRGDAMAESPDDEHDLAARIERLQDPAQYRYLSAEELRTFLDPGADWVVADLGSGTGFFADELAPVVERLYAVDVRDEMHDAYRSRGVPDNVELVTADVRDIPLADDTLDGAVSIRTFHHGVADGLDEVARVLRPGGRLFVIDWSATGAGERERGGRSENYVDLAAAQARLLDAGFRVREAHERRETFVVVARRRPD